MESIPIILHLTFSEAISIHREFSSVTSQTFEFGIHFLKIKRLNDKMVTEPCEVLYLFSTPTHDDRYSWQMVCFIILSLSEIDTFHVMYTCFRSSSLFYPPLCLCDISVGLFEVSYCLVALVIFLFP